MTMLALVAVLSQFPIDENTAAFEKLESADGITLLGRPVKGSPYQEYQLQTVAPYQVTDLCEAIFEWGTRGSDSPGMVLSKVLVDGENQRIVYAHISQPVVANRDYVLSVKREWLSPTHCRVRFRTTTESAPPKPEGFVRMEKLWGEWNLVAKTEGGSTVSYTLFSDPGGSVPSFLVHGGQKSAAKDSVNRAMGKAKAFVEKKK